MSNLELSADQAAAMEMVGRFKAQSDVLVARITGYAGTGKTTLIREMADVYGMPTVLTPTGKAALRVAEATGLHAQTIHRFLYKPEEDPKTGKLMFLINPQWFDRDSDMKGSLVLIDEASMVGVELWDDLMRVASIAGFHVLVMGDLFQLPPVSMKEDPFSALQVETPFSVNLTEVIRQALDSPIIRASMILRSGRPEHEAMRLLSPLGGAKFVQHVVDGRSRGGATICFTNARRHAINNDVRAYLGYAPDTIVAGEPLLVTQNNYKIDRYNGEVVDFGDWTLAPGAAIPVTDRFTNSSLMMSFGEALLAVSSIKQPAALEINGEPVDQPPPKPQACIISPEQVTGKSEIAKIGNGIIRRSSKNWYKSQHIEYDDILPHLDCNYGYGLTCHKSQGSEWPEILVVLEDSLAALRGIEKRRWLYTAITRAKEKVNYVYVTGRP